MSSLPSRQLLPVAHDERSHCMSPRRVLPIDGRFCLSAVPHWLLCWAVWQLELHCIAARQLRADVVEQCPYRLSQRQLRGFNWLIELHSSRRRVVFGDHWHATVPEGLFFVGGWGRGLYCSLDWNLRISAWFERSDTVPSGLFFGCRRLSLVHASAARRIRPRPRRNGGYAVSYWHIFKHGRGVYMYAMPHRLLLPIQRFHCSYIVHSW
jgi:hypothetical protein